jgi:hypothetical protein
VKPLDKIRSGAGSIGSFGRGIKRRAVNLLDGGRDGAAELWERSGARLIDGARANPRVAIAWAALGLLVLAWIGWTAYVWTNNGSAAGVGVLISWPAVFGALALIAAPFVGAAILVRRHRPGDGAPPIAGGAEASGSGADTEAVTGGTYPG